MIQPSVCGEWEEKWNVWACQQVIKKYKCLQKKKENKRKIIDTTKIRVDIMLEKEKKKVVEKNKSETNTWV